MTDFIFYILIFAVVLISLFLFYIIFILIYASIKPPKTNPKRFLNKKRKKFEDFEKKKVVVFIGDSITRGNYGVNYIKILMERLNYSEYEFINAGINGDLTVNVLKRLDEIIQCKPDFVILLIGSNDVNGSQSSKWAKVYELTKNVPKDPLFWTEERFKEDLGKIIRKLMEEIRALIAIGSIPPIGECPNTPSFEDSKRYSRIIENLAADFNVNYLPLNETITTQIQENPTQPNFPYEKLSSVSMLKFLFLHCMGRSWEKISKMNGLQFLTDNLHLNKAGATVVADLVEKFLLQNRGGLKDDN
ncbi:MAG: SGNH/GDSL hydrolase family protein [Promethearchaeota archaeon]